MKLVLIIVDLLTAAFLYAVGRYFIKSKNTKRSILFLAGDYSGLNTQKICRVVGKRFKTGAILFLFGSIIDFVKPGAGITTATVAFLILMLLHLVDMTINRNRKYRV